MADNNNKLINLELLAHYDEKIKEYIEDQSSTANNGTLTIQKNGSNVATFTANQATNTTANIVVPTKPSDIGALAADGSNANRDRFSINSNKIYLGNFDSDSNDGEIIEANVSLFEYNDSEVATHNWVESNEVFEKGSANNSGVLKGQSNQAFSQASVSLGKENLSGLKGWYYSGIKIANTSTPTLNVYLSKDQVIPTWNDDTKDTTTPNLNPFQTLGKYTIVSLVNDSKYDNKFKIVGGGPGVVQLQTVDGSAFPFTSIKKETNLSPEDYTIYCLSKPDQGPADIGHYTFVTGRGNKAINVATAVFGTGNIANGKLAIVGGKNNEGGYNTVTFGAENVNNCDNAFVAGTNINNTGNNSFITGNKNINKGKRAHLEGNNNQNNSTGMNNHIEGENNVIETGTAANVHLAGIGNKTSTSNQTVVGKYNAKDNNALLIVGRGSSDTVRANAFEAGYDSTNGDFIKVGTEILTASKLAAMKNPANASTTAKGIVQLTDSTSSTSTTTAATPKNVKSAYDLANTANAAATAAQAKAESAYNKVDTLEEKVVGTEETADMAYDMAFKALPKSGGTTDEEFSLEANGITLDAGSDDITLSGNCVWIGTTEVATVDDIPTVFKGATATSNGSAGLVPAPPKELYYKFLKADGNWVTPPNTTYSLSKSGSTIILTDNNGNTTSVEDFSSSYDDSDIISRIKTLEEDVEIIKEQIACFRGDTQILMADGSTKDIKDVKYGDMIKSYDIENDCLVDVKSYGAYATGFEQFWNVTSFTNGSVLYIARDGHYLYHPLTQKLVMSENFPIRGKAYSSNGDKPYLVGRKRYNGYKVEKRYELISENGLFFANDILAGHAATSTFHHYKKGHLPLTEEEAATIEEDIRVYVESDMGGLDNPEFLKECGKLLMVVNKRKEKIEEWKNRLAKMDYKQVKWAQGKLSELDYKKYLSECETWRACINESEVKLTEEKKKLKEARERFGINDTNRREQFLATHRNQMRRIKERQNNSKS